MTASPPTPNRSAVLVVGASGFVGRHVSRALLEDGRAVRGLLRNPGSRTAIDPRVQLVAGDMLDADSLTRAAEGVGTLISCVHTLSAQPRSARTAGFMDIEHAGIRSMIDACVSNGVRRIIHVTSLGVGPDAPSLWLRERYRLERHLLESGLDATVFRPGMIVGRGGHGFEQVLAGARRRVATTLSPKGRTLRPIAVEDLAAYLARAIDEPRSYGRAFDVGTDEVLTIDEITARTAEMLGNRPPLMLHLPTRLLRLVAPAIERVGSMPRGSVRGMVDGLATDLVGDTTDVREVLGAPSASFAQALRHTLEPPTRPGPPPFARRERT